MLHPVIIFLTPAAANSPAGGLIKSSRLFTRRQGLQLLSGVKKTKNFLLI
jgi:hypothetical protein